MNLVLLMLKPVALLLVLLGFLCPAILVAFGTSVSASPANLGRADDRKDADYH